MRGCAAPTTALRASLQREPTGHGDEPPTRHAGRLVALRREPPLHGLSLEPRQLLVRPLAAPTAAKAERTWRTTRCTTCQVEHRAPPAVPA